MIETPDFKNSNPIASQDVFEKLIIDNQNFAYSIVNKEFGNYPWDIKMELNSAALEGLVYAATKYDPAREHECKFISYAVHWIRYYINEEIRKLYPIKLNQNFICKRKKINKCIENYKKEHGKDPDVTYISSCVGMSKKVVQNILNINNGENFQFVSFNAPVDVGDSSGSESFNESKLVNEYFETSLDNQSTTNFEFNDLMNTLKENVPELDYNLFYDYYVNSESFSDLAKKYNLKFPSSVSYLIKKCEKVCKELV